MDNRIPRLMGLTGMMAQYNQAREEDKEVVKLRVIKYVVNQWALNNGLLCNTSYNPNSLALYLSCSIEDIQDVMKENLLTNRMWDKDQQESMITSIMGMSLNMALEDRMEAASQVEILKQSQNGHYVPFISSELRMSLDLKMKAGTNLLNTIKGISGGTLNIFTQINQQNTPTTNLPGYITKEEALSLVEDTTSRVLPNNSDTVNYLEARYNFQDLPEVCARAQEIDTSKEGLDLRKNELLQITDDYRIHREEPEEVDFHEIRRELEQDIDDEDDPEFTIE